VKLHRSRRLAAGTALLVALPLTGCTTPGAEPGVAARVGDRTVAERDVDAATTELAQLGLGQQFDTARVTEYLALGPLLLEELQKRDVAVGPADAQRLVKTQGNELSPATTEVLMTQYAAGRVQEAQQVMQQFGPTSAQGKQYRPIAEANQAFTTRMQDYARGGEVDFNPKYMKQPANWVLQDGMAGQPQQAPPQ